MKEKNSPSAVVSETNSSETISLRRKKMFNVIGRVWLRDVHF